MIEIFKTSTLLYLFQFKALILNVLEKIRNYAMHDSEIKSNIDMKIK